MTRDEARFALQGPLGEHFGHKVPEGVDDAWLDCWAALGMLKLDKPKSATERLCKELGWGGMNQAALEVALNATGLKIIEK